MKRLIVLVFVGMMTLAVSTLAQQKTGQHKTTKVSREFAQAANKALVAIGNSVNEEALTLDPIVQQAFNDANAAAFSKAENEIITRLTVLAAERPLNLALLRYTAPDSEKHQEAVAGLSKVDGCITAMRKVLHSLSGDEPQECKQELP